MTTYLIPSVISISSSIVLFHRYHTLLPNFLHCLRDQITDMRIAISRDSSDLDDLCGGGDGFGMCSKEFDDTVDGGLRSSTEIHWIAAKFMTPSEYMARARTVGCCRTVTGYFVRLLSDVLNET
jgi:hypothetical protein